MTDDHLPAPTGSKRELFVKRLLIVALPVLVIGAAVGGTVVMSALQPEPEQTEDAVEAIPVLTTLAWEDDVALSVQSQGEVVPRAEVTLAAEAGGRVVYISPSLLPGGQFRRGETLVRVDAKEYELRVVQAEANVAQARTAIATERSQSQTAELEARDLGLENISDLALRRPQLAEAEARLASAEAQLAEAKLHLLRTTVRAPFEGRVKTKTVDIGAIISPGTPLADVYSSDVVEVPIPLSDNDLSALGLGIGFRHSDATPGPMVTLTATVAGQSHRWSGRIVRTDSGIDSQTRVLFAYVEVEDPYGANSDDGTPLAVGLFVNASIDGKAVQSATIIPRTALRGKDRVYIARDDDTLEIRNVSVVTSDRERAVIADGLTPGERVITSPVRGVADGMSIKVVDKVDGAGATTVAAAN